MGHHAATYPGKDWEHISSTEAGFDPEKLDQAREWLDDEAGDTAYRVVIVRGGRIVAEWNRGLDRYQRLSMYSASKSVFSSVLGIAIDEGRISSADARLTDYYPEAMDVPEGDFQHLRVYEAGRGTGKGVSLPDVRNERLGPRHQQDLRQL